MKVITKQPVYYNKEKIAGEDFLNAPGQIGKTATSVPMPKPTSEPTQEEKKKKALEGFTWDKAKGNWEKVKEKAGKAGGFIDNVLALFGTKGETTPEPTVAPVATEEKKGMSTGVKVALIGGGVVVVGLLVYLAVRKK